MPELQAFLFGLDCPLDLARIMVDTSIEDSPTLDFWFRLAVSFRIQ